MNELFYPFNVMRDPIILYMASQFRLENFPYFFQWHSISNLLGPFCSLSLVSLSLFSLSFSVWVLSFPVSRFPVVERKSQKIECPLFYSFSCLFLIESDQLRLLFIKLKLKLFKSFSKRLALSVAHLLHIGSISLHRPHIGIDRLLPLQCGLTISSIHLSIA